MLALIFYIFLALIVAAIVISVLLCALFLLWILVKIGLGLHVKVLEYGTLYTTAYPTISMVILAPYLANKALDFRNELDRKLCDLQDPDDELMLRDMSRSGNPRFTFDVEACLVRCDLALSIVEGMWLLDFELTGGVTALFLFHSVYMQYEDTR